MLVDGIDSQMRQLLDELFASEDDRALEVNFAQLTAELDYRRAEHARSDREQRRQGGGPTRARLLRDGELDAAVAEWSELTGTQTADDDTA